MAIPKPFLVIKYVLAHAPLSVCLQQCGRTDSLSRRDLRIISMSRGNLYYKRNICLFGKEWLVNRIHKVRY